MKPSPKDLAAALVACLVSLVALARSDSGHPAAVAALRWRPKGPPPSREAVERLRSAEPLELNRASASDLVLLPGVGPKLAAHIVEERTRRGGFAQVEELRQVKGVGPVLLARVRALLRVSGPPPPKALTAPAPTSP